MGLVYAVDHELSLVHWALHHISRKRLSEVGHRPRSHHIYEASVLYILVVISLENENVEETEDTL